MTLRELYESIQGDYDRAIRVLRVEKLVDKHIRKLETNGAVDGLLAAGEKMDENGMFEYAHAVKGICGNLGLVKLAEAASEITEEYRPGNSRTLSDEQVRERIAAISALYKMTLEGIHRYIEG